MRRIAPFLLALLLLASCASSASSGEEGFQLYFASTRNSGPSLVAVPYRGEDPPGADSLLAALLAGPGEDEDAASPFPRGLGVLGWELREDGVLSVDLSEPYSGLSDVSLTLADYCIVLTLGQLEGVEQVEITVAGRPLSYRSHQILSPEEVLLQMEPPS